MKKMYNNTFPQQKIKIKKLYLNFFKNILKIIFFNYLKKDFY